MAIQSGQAANASDLTEITPVGSVLAFAGSSAPTGYLMCDGSAVSRTTYGALFALIGTTYGAGNGTTTFNLPDIRGRVVVAKSSDTEFDVLGETGGAKTHALSIAELAAHDHGFIANSTSTGGTLNIPGGSGASTIGTKTVSSTGSGTPHNNLQPYITLNYIIRYIAYS